MSMDWHFSIGLGFRAHPFFFFLCFHDPLWARKGSAQKPPFSKCQSNGKFLVWATFHMYVFRSAGYLSVDVTQKTVAVHVSY